MRLIHKLSAVALAMSAAALSPSAHALSFVFNDTTPGGMSAAQLGAFQAAANYWSSQFSDKVTVYLNISFRNDGNNGILGSTGSTYDEQGYATIRGAMAADAKSTLDATAVASLQPGSALAFQSTNLDGTTRFNNDTSNAQCASNGPCDFDNRFLALTTANAKALGIAEGTNAANPDAEISFNGFYSNMFKFDRNGGIPNNKTDFITVAEHEIGHALGFVSGVDTPDFCMNTTPGADNNCTGFGVIGKYGLEQFSIYSPLDLFRYSADGVLDFTVGTASYFSVNGGGTSIENFATGAFNGDGWQASHFGPDALNLMRPFIGNGESYDATPRDLAAFDAIGWDIKTAVPEPETYALMLAGLGAVAWVSRRRARNAA